MSDSGFLTDSGWCVNAVAFPSGSRASSLFPMAHDTDLTGEPPEEWINALDRAEAALAAAAGGWTLSGRV